MPPASNVNGNAKPSGTEASIINPNRTLVSARMEATDRSISRTMIKSAMGSTSSAFSEALAASCDRLKAEKKLGTNTMP